MKTDVARPVAGPPPEEPDPDTASSKRTIKLLLLFMGIMSALWVMGPIVFSGHDDPTAIDSKAVRPTVSDACHRLRDDLGALPAGMPVKEKAEAENRAADQLVATVRALGPDKLSKDSPVDQWLADWDRIIALRREAARDGKSFATPVENNAPINVRMFSLIRSGLEHCDVPKVLLAPEPGTL